MCRSFYIISCDLLNELWHIDTGRAGLGTWRIIAKQATIRFYQRRLSPHKGFCCAYRAHTGRRSCFYRAVPLRQVGAVKLAFRDAGKTFDPKAVYDKPDHD